MKAGRRRRGYLGLVGGAAKRWWIGAALMVAGGTLGLALASASSAGPNRLPYSTASNLVVQRQPPPGSCHAIGAGLYQRPDPRCTPGALNPAVTQATIGRTICGRGWTQTVRPPEWVTEQEKWASLAAYGDRGPLSAYEYDHLVPLELGGATNDPRNLWPEPGRSPNLKDRLERELNLAVCAGRIGLARAQLEIATNWVALARRLGSSGPPPATGPRQPKPWCSASARYNPRYHDYDVYVRSNQPERSVTATAPSATHSWWTDDEGSADVYLRAGPAAAGERVNVRVGAATCSTTLP